MNMTSLQWSTKLTLGIFVQITNVLSIHLDGEQYYIQGNLFQLPAVPIDIILKIRMINGTYCMPCLVLLVPLTAATKMHSKEKVLVASTKQIRQEANQAG
jgi:hypothetical protein